MNPFKNVEVNKPPKITVAIGLWISFPGRSPFNANGINAKAELNAVIKIDIKRSSNPSNTNSPKTNPSQRKSQYRMISSRDTDLAGSKP